MTIVSKILEKTKSLKHFEIDDFVDQFDDLSVFAQALMENQSLERLALKIRTEDDDLSTIIFDSLAR